MIVIVCVLVSSTLKIPALSGISNCDLTNDGDNFDSMEDLNKEIENLCPFNTNALLPHQLKIANSRYCDIFSRQSMESDENSSPDDEERIKFLATIPQYGCEVLQLVPKKPVMSAEHNEMYQPCSNTTIQLKQSSFSAFRDMSEIKNPKQQADIDNKSVVDDVSKDDNDDDNNASACAAASSQAAASCQDDQQWRFFSMRYLKIILFMPSSS